MIKEPISYIKGNTTFGQHMFEHLSPLEVTHLKTTFTKCLILRLQISATNPIVKNAWVSKMATNPPQKLVVKMVL
jgi:hypothetical protein